MAGQKHKAEAGLKVQEGHGVPSQEKKLKSIALFDDVEEEELEAQAPQQQQGPRLLHHCERAVRLFDEPKLLDVCLEYLGADELTGRELAEVFACDFSRSACQHCNASEGVYDITQGPIGMPGTHVFSPDQVCATPRFKTEWYVDTFQRMIDRKFPEKTATRRMRLAQLNSAAQIRWIRSQARDFDDYYETLKLTVGDPCRWRLACTDRGFEADGAWSLQIDDVFCAPFHVNVDVDANALRTFVHDRKPVASVKARVSGARAFESGMMTHTGCAAKVYRTESNTQFLLKLRILCCAKPFGAKPAVEPTMRRFALSLPFVWEG